MARSHRNLPTWLHCSEVKPRRTINLRSPIPNLADRMRKIPSADSRSPPCGVKSKPFSIKIADDRSRSVQWGMRWLRISMQAIITRRKATIHQRYRDVVSASQDPVENYLVLPSKDLSQMCGESTSVCLDIEGQLNLVDTLVEKEFKSANDASPSISPM